MNSIFNSCARICAAIAIPALGASVALAAEAPTYSSSNYANAHAKGLKRTEKSKMFLQTAPRTTVIGTHVDVPNSYSLQGQAGPVEDQGQCGSCWDFSLTEALRGTFATAGKDPGRLSFNYLLNCSTTDAGCDGGDFDAAQLFVAPAGAPAYGTDGEYTATGGACQQEKAVASATSFTLVGQEAGNAVSFQDIAYVVGVLHQPVSIDVAVDDNWEGYSGGVFNGCNSSTQINHMVVIEGYDCEGTCKFDANGNLPAGVGQYLIRNSWGDGWGEGGYIRTKATDSTGAPCNSVATDALYYKL